MILLDQMRHPEGTPPAAACLCECSPRWAVASPDPSVVASISSQYHRGKNPTRSSPPMTSSTPDASSLTTMMPALGVKVTRQTSLTVLVGSVSCKNDRNWSPQAKQIRGSQAPDLPRTDRGISTVRNDCVVTSCPEGLRKPTTISYLTDQSLACCHRTPNERTGTPRRNDCR